MTAEDSKAPFLRIPWTAALLNKPNTVCRVPGSRSPKHDNEDALFADTLRTSNTFRSMVAFFQRPASPYEHINEISTLILTGSGMDGHDSIMHGGIVSTVLDESMGVLQTANLEREHLINVQRGFADGELPPHSLGSFTVELKVKFLKPVHTPGPLVVTARYTKREGRKEWIYAEIRQRHGFEEDYDGDEVVCAIGEALFVWPRNTKL